MIDSVEISNTISLPSLSSITFSTYENASKGIKIDYPTTWTVKEVDFPPQMEIFGFGVGFLSPRDSNSDNLQESLFLTAVSPFESSSIDKFLVGHLIDLRNNPNNDENINITRFTISGVPAALLTFTSNNSQIYNVQAYAIKSVGFDDAIYSINFEADTAKFKNIYWPIVQKMIDSFVISGFLNYTDSIAGIQIKYPFDWIKIDGNSSEFAPSVSGSTYNSSVSFYSPFSRDSREYPAASFLMQVENLPSDKVALDDYTNGTLENLRKEPSIKLINVTEFNLPGSDQARRILYTYSFEGVKYTDMTVMSIKNGKAYYFDYSAETSAFTRFLPAVQKMLESFRIL
jgi:hypothetical protein